MKGLLLAALLLSALSMPPAPSEPAVWEDCAAPGGYAACECCNPSAYIATDEEVDALARLLYGEAQSCTVAEQAAVVWCVLNRVDSGDEYFPDTVMGVVTQPNQFFGYSRDYPVLPELVEVAEDVLRRYNVERSGIDSVGRVLPREYLYFSGDGVRNYFTVDYGGTDVWDWGMLSPHREGP